MVQNVEDLKVMRYVFEHTHYASNWEHYAQIDRMVGDAGLPVVLVPYMGSGFLMSRCAGAECTILFPVDAPAELRQTIRTINHAHLEAFALVARGPAPVIAPGDQLPPDGDLVWVTRTAEMADGWRH